MIVGFYEMHRNKNKNKCCWRYTKYFEGFYKKKIKPAKKGVGEGGAMDRGVV